MSLLVPTVGLNAFLTLNLASDLTLKLYSNNRTPALTNVASDYTVVAGGGYANITLTGGAWSIASGVATFATQTFTFTGATNSPGTVYGYYVVNGAGTLMFAERFPTVPFTPANGTNITITPRIVLANAVP